MAVCLNRGPEISAAQRGVEIRPAQMGSSLARNPIEVHDYVDIAIPMLARMHDKRLTALATLGFDTPTRDRRRRGAATAPPLDLQ
jgi:hypothetical protein